MSSSSRGKKKKKKSGSPGGPPKGAPQAPRPAQSSGKMSGPALWLTVLVAVGLAGLAGYAFYRTMGERQAQAPSSGDIDAMLASEQMILEGTLELRKLSKSAMNLAVPDHRSLALFTDEVRVRDLDGAAAPSEQFEIFSLQAVGKSRPVSTQEESIEAEAMSLWRPVLDDVEYFEHAKFYFVDGDPLAPDDGEWRSDVGFHGLAKMQSGEWCLIHADQTLEWTRVGEEQEIESWRISGWLLESFETIVVPQRPFSDAIDHALKTPSARERARTSIHEERVAAFLFDLERPESERTFEMPNRYFRGPAQDRHPGLAVTDIDGDGHDDLYVMSRWGKNELYVNEGNGTFRERASRYGLDIEDHSAAGLFADFDNDGDPDLFLGRTLERSRYYVNEGGRFVDRSESLVDIELPYLVSAVTATDYDNDGLLDLYVSTYASDAMKVDFQTFGGQQLLVQTGSLDQMRRVLSDYLSVPDQERLHNLVNLPSNEYHVYRNSYGPPNILLRNVGGGRFAEARDVPELRVFRHTYQGTWADYDQDGDPDLYLANDFAPNNHVPQRGRRSLYRRHRGDADRRHRFWHGCELGRLRSRRLGRPLHLQHAEQSR